MFLSIMIVWLVLLFNQKSPVNWEAGFPQCHTQTERHRTQGYRDLEIELAQWADSVKIKVHIRAALSCIWTKEDKVWSAPQM